MLGIFISKVRYMISYKEVQSFVGFVNFYQRFIKDFSHHAHALFNLTKKDVGWKWEESEQVAFNKLKESITSAPVLIFPDNSCPYHIEANSSNVATGAVLSQQTSSKNGGKMASNHLLLQKPQPHRVEL